MASAPKAFALASVIPPALATQPADGISYTKATLHGTVDPEGGNSNPIGPPGLLDLLGDAVPRGGSVLPARKSWTGPAPVGGGNEIATA